MKKIGRLSGMAAFVFAGAITAWAYTYEGSKCGLIPPTPPTASCTVRIGFPPWCSGSCSRTASNCKACGPGNGTCTSPGSGTCSVYSQTDGCLYWETLCVCDATGWVNVGPPTVLQQGC